MHLFKTIAEAERFSEGLGAGEKKTLSLLAFSLEIIPNGRSNQRGPWRPAQ
jgi:hypothetical protein